MSAIPPEVLYVGGYGRSGSSLLDMVLGASPSVFGAGEVGAVFRYASAEGARCSCGAPYLTCDVWGPVLSGVLGDTGLSLGDAVAVTRTTETRYGGDDRYWPLWRGLFTRLVEVTGCATIVDSTKTTRTTEWRPTRLAQAGLRVGFVHLVRDPTDVLVSATRGRNQLLAKGEARPRAALVPAVSWLYANALADLQQHTSLPRPGVVLRYEDFVSSPSRVLGELEATFGLDLAASRALVEAGREVPAGHGVAGNRMRAGGGTVVSAPRDEAPDVPRSTTLLGRALGAVGRGRGWTRA